MRFSYIKRTQPILFMGVLGATSLILLINVDPSRAIEPSHAGNYYKPTTLCTKSVPEPYPFVGISALGILGGGYLLRQRMRKKVDDFNNNSCLSINPYTPNHQQPQKISFIYADEESQENYYPLSASLELQLIDPTEIISNNQLQI
ncbi:hypothetical protein NIES2109_62410 (plasmid) [Nostoc sp. HK-01]|nr:hypothetical protein NIES2109_62410 [Nostoc sp. HK-01]